MKPDNLQEVMNHAVPQIPTRGCLQKSQSPMAPSIKCSLLTVTANMEPSLSRKKKASNWPFKKSFGDVIRVCQIFIF